MQAEMTEWEPRTINGFSLPLVNCLRKTKHTGQQRFDTPITRPKSYLHNTKGKDLARNELERV